MTVRGFDPAPVEILGLTSERFVEAARGRGVCDSEAVDLYRRTFREGRSPVAWIRLPDMTVGRVERDHGAVKFTLRAADGLETESVLLPQRSRAGRARQALCVSAQVGCARGCAFCETARMGLLRNLGRAEIVAQWRTATFELGQPVDNVVFMGMGEPMDNLDAVLEAVRVLTDRNGPAVPASRIGISTVGRVDGIERLSAFVREPGFRRLRLAVSLNAPEDAIRSRLMPINRADPMAALRAAMLNWPGRPILIEYVLIPGVNDEPAHADALSRYLEPVACIVNVIPYNPIHRAPWPAPSRDEVDRFVDRLAGRGRLVTRRRTLGRAVSAACGQLANRSVRRRPRTAAN